MTEPEPNAPPAPGAHPQEHATQPLPMAPLSSDTPYAPSGFQPQHQQPPVPSGQVVPAVHQPPYGYPHTYGYPPAHPYPYGYQHPPRPTNGMAIAALVLGILWLYWLGSVLALIFGYIALAQIKKAPADAPQQGHGLAVAGVVLGWVGVATLVLPMLVFLVMIPLSGL